MNNVLIYTENYVTGGGNKYLADIINSIPEKYKIFIISNKGGLEDVDLKLIEREFDYFQIDVRTYVKVDKKLFKIKNVSVLIYKILRRIFFYLLLFSYKKKNIKIFFEVIARINPALVIACDGGYPAALSVLDLIIACKKKSVKCILTVVSMPQNKSFIDLFYGEVVASVNKVIVNSAKIKNKLVIERDFKENDVAVIHNAVADYRAETWEFHKNTGETLFAYVGRIEKNKGSYVLLDAFKTISDKNNNNKKTRLLMIGSGPELEEIKKYANDLGLGDRVVFTGYLNINIYSILALIDIFVFPSFWEGFPYSILEAMNAGKIIISTNVGGIPEAITNKKEGILIQARNILELSDAMEDVMSKFDEYLYLGTNAQKKIAENFKFINFKEQVAKLIMSIDN